MDAILPLPPSWIVEALGLIELDPNAVYDGPYAKGNGRVELRFLTPGETALTKVLVLDDRRGHILEQHVYDLEGSLLASAQMSDYRFDQVHGVALPHVVTISLPPAEVAFSFKMDGYTINDISGDPVALWSMPQLPNVSYVDLMRMQ